MSKPSSRPILMIVGANQTLHPVAPYDAETIDRFAVGSQVRIQVAQSRSQPRHRLYWVTLREVAKNSLYTSEEALHKSLLVGAGVVEPVIAPNGEIFMTPSSIAFEKMGEEEFKIYFDEAMRLISECILPGVDIDELLAQAKSQGKLQDAA